MAISFPSILETYIYILLAFIIISYTISPTARNMLNSMFWHIIHADLNWFGRGFHERRNVMRERVPGEEEEREDEERRWREWVAQRGSVAAR